MLQLIYPDQVHSYEKNSQSDKLEFIPFEGDAVIDHFLVDVVQIGWTVTCFVRDDFRKQLLFEFAIGDVVFERPS